MSDVKYGYGIGRDVATYVKGWNPSELLRLSTTGKTYHEDGGNWTSIYYRPKSLFRVSKMGGHPARCRKPESSSSIVDIERWFRGRHLGDVLREWGCGDINELVGRMKEVLKSAGLPCSYPLSSGVIAGQVAYHKGAKAHCLQETPPEVREASRRAFFTGREQQFRFGRFEGPLYGWDINSAYGWALTKLPSMLGEWENRDEFDEDCIGLWEVDWNIPGAFNVCPFPARRGGDQSVTYPLKGRGWQWSPLVIEAKRWFKDYIRIRQGHVFTPDFSERPFDYIQGLYDRRRGMNKHEGKLIKLVINSTWGTLCRDDETASLEWAGLATSYVNARMLWALMRNPGGNVSCCVDGFWTTSNAQLASSDNLGGWKEQYASEGLFIRPTMYWVKQGEWKSKCAGVIGGDELAQEALDAWESKGMGGRIRTSFKSAVGLLAAAKSRSWERLGEEITVPITLHMHPNHNSGQLDAEMVRGAKNHVWECPEGNMTESSPFVARRGNEVTERERLEECA